MQWNDKGIILRERPYGETHRIITILTEEHGRHAGLVRISTKSKNSQTFQPGNYVDAVWSARLPDQLGYWKIDPLFMASARLLNHPKQLAALSAACSIMDIALPERHPYNSLYQALEFLIDKLLWTENWHVFYIYFELCLLNDLGFGLDLKKCAVTGTSDNLVYVSPKTGRAVSSDAGKAYHDHLLVLPTFIRLGSIECNEPREIEQGMTLTGYFLHRHIFMNGGLPPIRQRLAEMIYAA